MLNLASTPADDQANKGRRIRACDPCRRRKVRCDGGGPPAGHRCGNCIAFRYDCTYTAASEKRFSNTAYVKSLEQEVAKLRARLGAVGTIGPPFLADSNSKRGVAPLSGSSRSTAVLQLTPGVTSLIEGDADESEEAAVELMNNMSLDTQHTQYLGRSSSLAFVRTAMALKEEYTQSDSDTPSNDLPGAHDAKGHARTPEFWDATPLLIFPETPYPLEAFPEPTLLAKLVEEYFFHFGVYFPLLHRPTFEGNIRDGLHLRDEGFGSTLLLVCALAGRFSSDARVLPTETKSWHWAGWPWFQRVRSTRKLINLTSPTLYDLQLCVLVACYITMSPVVHAVYPIIGHGIRIAQDMGVHRRTMYGPRLTIEEELKKRAFWCLICMECGLCDRLGRPYNIHYEDFDLDLPVECDDEYWTNDDPDLAFKQPPGKPSKASVFIQVIRLGRILSHAYRIIHRAPIEKLLSNPDEAQRAVSQIDSELNEFITSLPDHLKWDTQNDDFFVHQSAMLHASYYTIQITVHRPFVPLPKRPSPLSFPSLAICTNAARSCIRVMEVQYYKLGSSLSLHWYQMSLFTCSVILLLNVWYGKMAGIAINPEKELKDVKKAMHMLQSLESRWITAARLWDILNDIVEAMNRPKAASGPSSQRRQKRRHEDSQEKLRAEGGFEESPFTATGSQPPSSWNQTSTQYPVSAADNATSTLHAGSIFPQSAFDFTLPLHSDELGRLPIWSDAGIDSSTTTSGEAMWPFFASDPMVGLGTLANTMFQYDGQQPHMDPDLEAIFADLIPDAAWNYTPGMVSQPAIPHLTQPLGVSVAGGSHQPFDALFNPGSSSMDEPHIPDWT